MIDFLTYSVSNSQFGFLRGKSSQQQLPLMVHNIASNLERHHQSDIIYMDFSKAFDSVCHWILLDKLWTMGITGEVHVWLRSYIPLKLFSNCVHQWSSFKTASCDVRSPSGQYFGTSHVSHLPKVIQSCLLLLIVDDTKCLYKSCNSTHYTSPALQSDLNLLYQWSINNSIDTIKQRQCY